MNAFRAMKAIGINEDKVKPVLKRLLKLYDKNWELIEEENYRVLADAIFDEDDSKVSDEKENRNLSDAVFYVCCSKLHSFIIWHVFLMSREKILLMKQRCMMNLSDR
ncbi:hypothetical protein GH714_026839 [Hevea brasiliensis]|uniref:WIYLD domain-containing protein n=1 Tax=Hevea brasiliensis TaxID=3981 RepID=A0A6A6L2H6_HEVBR|nr:hypothetical protein GH714_026839 [Hevea brasiliensis]